MEKQTKENLLKQIEDLYETNTGDFKRKVGLYLNRFIQTQTDPHLKQKIQILKDDILYKELDNEDEMANIDQLRWELLEKLNKYLGSS